MSDLTELSEKAQSMLIRWGEIESPFWFNLYEKWIKFRLSKNEWIALQYYLSYEDEEEKS